MFMGIGSVANALAIVAGGLIGMIAGRFLKERFQETILTIVGFGVMVMALGSTMAQMLVVDVEKASLDTQGAIMMIVSLAIGALIGEAINLDALFERFGAFLKEKTGSQGDAKFIDAFVTASLTVCVGAMAIMGAIQEGIEGDPNTLFSKAVIDLIIILIMASSMGKGAIFSAIPVLIWQGSITFLAGFLAPVMTEAAVSNLSLVGNVLIMCVGVNIVWPKTIRVANVLPAIVIAVVFAFF